MVTFDLNLTFQRSSKGQIFTNLTPKYRFLAISQLISDNYMCVAYQIDCLRQTIWCIMMTLNTNLTLQGSYKGQIIIHLIYSR